MKKIIVVLVYSIILSFHNHFNAQSFLISGETGVSFKNNYYANGYSFGINVLFNRLKNHKIGISLSNSFMSSAHFLPDNKKDANFHLRDFTNITPLGEDYNLGWNLDSWEPIRLKTHSNRYYNLNYSLNYFFDTERFNSLKIGSELILTFRDQMEIAKVLNVKEMEFWIPVGLTLYDYNIPIYAYDTYLDIGFAPYIQYNLFKYKRLDIDIKTKVYIFPKSGEMIYNFSTVFIWKKPEGEKKKLKVG